MARKNIAARRKLTDLYVKGVEIRFDASGATRGPFEEKATEDQVAIWVQPPDPLQREMALREGQASRARASLNVKRDKDSEEYLTALNFVQDMGTETLIDYVLMIQQEDRHREAMRDVLSKDEWDDMSALQDAMRQFEEEKADEDDPEYAGLIERDVEFGRQVAVRLKELTEAAREVMKMTPQEAMQKKALERRAELIGSQAFMKVYEREMLYFGCRDPEDHRDLFFDSVKELSSQPEFVLDQLGALLAEFITDGGQAKNSLRAASSSDLSAPPAEPVTSEASTPEEQTG